MLYRDFIKLSDARREELFRYWVEEMDLAKDMMLEGHSEKLHIAKDRKEMLDRVLNKGGSSSAFNSYEEAAFNAKEALFFHQKRIMNWLKTRDFKDPKDFRRLELNTEMYSFETEDEVIAYGIDRQLNEKKTSVSRMVLERNLNVSSQNESFLFYIKTFFPDIEHESAKETGRNFVKETEEIIDGKRLKRDISLLQKARWTFKALGYEPFDTVNKKGEGCLCVPFKYKDTSFTIILKENSIRYNHPYINVKDGSNWIKLEKQNKLSEQTKNDVEEYGLYLKSILDFVNAGMSIKDIKEEIVRPDIEKEMELQVVTKKEKEKENDEIEETLR